MTTPPTFRQGIHPADAAEHLGAPADTVDMIRRIADQEVDGGPDWLPKVEVVITGQPAPFNAILDEPPFFEPPPPDIMRR